MDAVRKQIEYYFSVNNLCKDIFLRSKGTSRCNHVGFPDYRCTQWQRAAPTVSGGVHDRER
eukprot:scaffold109089_cov19-Tisochrysis_lutea.AAC.2